MSKKKIKQKIWLLSFLGIIFVLIVCFIIYDSYQIKDPKHYFDLGIKASYPRNIPEEIKNFKKAIYYCHKDISKHKRLAISSYLGLATAYMHKESYGQAEETLLEGLKVSLKHFGPDSIATFRIYEMLSLYASYDKDIEKSKKYSKKALAIQKRLKKKQNLSTKISKE